MRTSGDDQPSLFEYSQPERTKLPSEAGSLVATISSEDVVAPEAANSTSPSVELEEHKLVSQSAQDLLVDDVKRATSKLGTNHAVLHPSPISGLEVIEPEDRLITVKEVALRLGTSVATVWRWAREREDFPKPRKVGPKSTRWSLFDLLAFARTLV